MTLSKYPVGMQFEVQYPAFTVRLTLLSETSLEFVIDEGPFAHRETVDILTIALRGGLFAVSWKEATGATVVNVQDFDRMEVHTHATLPDGTFIRMTGGMVELVPPDFLNDDRPNPQHGAGARRDGLTVRHAGSKHHRSALWRTLYPAQSAYALRDINGRKFHRLARPFEVAVLSYLASLENLEAALRGRWRPRSSVR